MKTPPLEEEIAPDLRPESPLVRWLLLLQRLLIIGMCAWIALNLPMPFLTEWLPVKNIVVAISAIVASGKALVDTLFFDRYWP